MLDGLWIVEFRTNLGLLGQGIAVLSGTRVFGGDSSFYYKGSYTEHEGTMSAEIDVVRYSATLKSVFGNVDNFHLTVSGKLETETEMQLVGHLAENPNMKVTVKGLKKAEM